jgi:hypothetical protein
MSIVETFGRSGFARFVNSPAGRVARVVAGLALIGWGYTRRSGGSGVVLMAAGLIPLAAGLFDWCLISALLGGPVSGARIRKGGS